jgi:hypothetical protein
MADVVRAAPARPVRTGGVRSAADEHGDGVFRRSCRLAGVRGPFSEDVADDREEEPPMRDPHFEHRELTSPTAGPTPPGARRPHVREELVRP